MEVPIVPYSARAGELGEYEQIINNPELKRMTISSDQYMRGEYAVFEVSGDSMIPEIYSGDKLLAKLVGRDYYAHSRLHLHKYPYWILVTHSEGIVVKKIIDHNVEEGFLLLHSLNELYPDYSVHLDDVIDIYHVVELVGRKMV